MFPRCDNQRRVAPNDREDVRDARQLEDHHHSASATRMVERKHKKSNKVSFVANDNVVACVDALHVPSPCFPACGRRVSLFTVFFVLLEGVAQASARVRVTQTLTGYCAVSIAVTPCPTDVIRSLPPKCMCPVGVSQFAE